MFDELKQQIRKEISNQKAVDMNHDVAQKLRKMGDDALEARNFERYIACYEIIAEDIEEFENNIGGVPKHKSGAVMAWQDLLPKYCDCGYSDKPEALALAQKCRKNVDEIMGAGTILPPVDMCLIDTMCANDINKYYSDIETIAMRNFKTGLRNYSRNTMDELSKMAISLSASTLVKIAFYRNDYAKASRVLSDIPNALLKATHISYISLIEMYNLNSKQQVNDNTITECKYQLEGWAQAGSPEANWILGIMSAEGLKYTKDIAKARYYFQRANDGIESLKGKMGYTKFDFTVLSKIPQADILKKAEAGNYYSKFYSKFYKSLPSNSCPICGKKYKGTECPTCKYQAPENSSNTNNNTTTSDSSDGCYVATCVYGSYDCPQVWTLRRFRDNTLAQNPFGRAFIKIYYAISPTAVKLFGNYNWFHKLFKQPLDRWVEKLNIKGVENTPYND